jgi:hypothetical protein
MNSSTAEQEKQQLMVWWVLWAAFQGGIFMIYHFVGHPDPAPSAAPETGPWLAAIAPFAVSVLIRFLVMPRLKSIAVALPVFIVGIAMAEFSCFLGIFIFPSHQRDLFILSVIGIFQFIPIYARSYLKSEG